MNTRISAASRGTTVCHLGHRPGGEINVIRPFLQGLMRNRATPDVVVPEVKVAGTGFEVPLVFRGKTYIVIRTGDAGGIFSPVARPHGRDQQAGHTD